jgi:hypothetical protein
MSTNYRSSERGIKCQDCSAEFTTAYAQTKRCPVCRTLKALDYVAEAHGYGFTIECYGQCGNTFAPLELQRERKNSHAGNRHKYCADCVRPYATDATGECAYCGRDVANLLHESIKVCRHCATDPYNRKQLVQHLRQKQRFTETASKGLLHKDNEAQPTGTADERAQRASTEPPKPRPVRVTDAARRVADKLGVNIDDVPPGRDGIDGAAVRRYAEQVAA